jgi:lysophospholipase L1-like esterase
MGNPPRLLKQVLALLGTSWSILGVTLAVILMVEGGFRLMFTLRDQLTAAPVPDRRVIALGYGGATWPVDHYRELELLQERWHPYVYFRQNPFRGKTITVAAGGLRATWQPPTPDKDSGQKGSIKILMLGGSSLWGFGARDDRTIPSCLAHSLHDRGWHVELKNLSEMGYVSTQELIALVRELQSGYRPDIVIFYDGVNDTTSALLEGEAGLTTNEVNRRDEFNLLQSPGRLVVSLGAKLVKDSGSYRFAQTVRRVLGGQARPSHTEPGTRKMVELAADVIAKFESNVKLAEGFGRAFRFRPMFFWQPTVFTKSRLVELEREEAQRYAWAEAMFREVYARIQASAQLRSDPGFYDLSGAFADSEGLVYIDYCHTTEDANARIASLMAVAVIEALGRPAPEAQIPEPQGGSDRLKGVE